MPVPYDLTLSDGRRHERYGPWRVDATAELIRARRRAGRSLHVATSRCRTLAPQSSMDRLGDGQQMRRAG